MSETKSKPEIKTIGVAGMGGIGSYLLRNLFDYGAKRDQFNFTEMTVAAFDDDVV